MKIRGLRARYFGAGVIVWRLQEDWRRLSKMDSFGLTEEEMIQSINDFRPAIAKVMNSHKTKDRARKLSEMQNLYENLARGDNDVAFDCCVNLLSYYDPSQQKSGVAKDPFLALPHLYVIRVQETGVFSSGTREREAASHYSKYTRDLCLTYFLRNGHLLTYVQYLIKQLFEVPLTRKAKKLRD